MSQNPRRHAAGTPVGGQFATGARSEPQLQLDAISTDDPTPRPAELVLAAIEASERRDPADSATPMPWTDAEKALRSAYPQVSPAVVSDDFLPGLFIAAAAGDHETLDALSDEMEEYAAREAKWRADATFEPPYTEDRAAAGDMYPDRVGSKYTGFRDVTEIAKDVRADLKEATRAGYLPEGVKYSVRVSKYAGGQAMDVEVRGLSDEQIYAKDPLSSQRVLTERTSLMRSRLRAISQAYDRDRSDSMTDYFDSLYYAHVTVEDERQAAYRTAAKTARRA